MSLGIRVESTPVLPKSDGGYIYTCNASIYKIKYYSTRLFTTTGTTSNIAYAQFDSTNPGITVNYTVVRGGNVRQGYLRIGQFLSNLAYDEEYTETADIGVTFVVSQIASTYTQVSAITSNTGFNATINANLQFTSSTFTY